MIILTRFNLSFARLLMADRDILTIFLLATFNGSPLQLEFDAAVVASKNSRISVRELKL